MADLNKYISKNHLKAKLQEADTAIILFIRDSSFKPAEFIYSFNNENKCISELKKACDSCITNYYEEAIKDNSYKWVKVNSTTALSKFSKHLILEKTGAKGNIILSVRKINWTKDQYNQYLEREIDKQINR